MISFCTPCFRWKLILATKYQNGWPGFVAPFQTRYLNKLVVITTVDPTSGQNINNGIRSQGWTIDRLTGNRTADNGTLNADAYFPYGDTLVNSGSETWEITDSYYKHTAFGLYAVTTEVTLSNPYTLDLLDADANALISSVSVLNMPWNTLMVAAYPEESIPFGPYTSNGDLTALIPPQVIYPGIIAPGPNVIPQLNAAAWSIFAPGFVNDQNWFPNGYSKLISYIAMAGNYCQKTYFVDYTQTLLNQTCQSGKGSCAAPFKITPARPPTPGQNSYVLIQPNCQCGG